MANGVWVDMDHKPTSFEAFWPVYLHEHSRPETRAFHVAGTVASLTCLAGAVNSLTRRSEASALPWLAGALVAGYGPAWISHFFLEGNRPATFEHPVWSFRGDLRMTWQWLTGSLKPEELIRSKR